MKISDEHDLQLLLELTAIPTAAGREHRVINYIEKWVIARDDLTLQTDEHGNLLITQKRKKDEGGPAPVFLTAHLDHPAFVVRRVIDNENVELEFRGGVRDNCFPEKEIEIFDRSDRIYRGKIVDFQETEPFRIVTAQLYEETSQIEPGDIGRWYLSGTGGQPELKGDLFHSPACDDLAGVAAAMIVLNNLRKRDGFEHVGLLLTRAEEIGFVGAIGAAKSESVSKDVRLICLEMSRSFNDSPIGAGPILRVGDFTGVFSRNLTNQFSQILREHEKQNPDFRWQRKLMPGGTCEATVFAEYGYPTACFCLPLGNYHNMIDASLPEGSPPTGGIGAEFISINDFRGLIETLTICIGQIDSKTVSLRSKLEARFAKGKHVL
ncbi:MAG TPA: hypothetical protein VK041_08990 [Opitutales bacterium]|nr:hypothetical protein [Opitutales bacterium]